MPEPGGARRVVASVLRVGMAVGGVWLVLVIAAWLFQERMIYLPDRSAPVVPSTAAEHVGVEEVRFETGDGLMLDAWYVQHPDPVATVVVANGNAGNRGHRLPFALALHERGHAVLLVDYRGYGGNPGRPHEDGVVADITAAVAWLATEQGIEADELVLYGESLGSAVVAAVSGAVAPAAVVLRSPFPSLADVARRHYPFLPVRTLLRERHPTARHLESYDGPVLVVAGERDRIVPAGLSRTVANAAGADYLEIAGAGHNDRALFDGDTLIDAVDAYVRRVR